MSKLHTISVRDPHHEHNAEEQSRSIASWIATHHPEMVVVPYVDVYGRHHVFVRHHEHDTADHIRREVATIFPSVPRLAHAPVAALPAHVEVVAIVKAPRKAAAKKAAPKLAKSGFYVIEACKKTWAGKRGKMRSHGPYEGIRAAQVHLKSLKADQGMNATIYHVGQLKYGHDVRWIETWTKARTLWHKNLAMSPRHHIIFAKSSFSEDFQEELAENSDVLEDHVRWVFEAMEDAHRRHDPPLNIVFNTNDDDAWITATTDAKTAHDLSMWASGYSFGLEQAFYEELAQLASEIVANEPEIIEMVSE